VPKAECFQLVFTDLIFQILYWIYEIAIHSRVFLLDLPTNIDLSNLADDWVGFSLF
jgi:hypothetical protein